jgi:chromosome segregation ATPase
LKISSLEQKINDSNKNEKNNKTSEIDTLNSQLKEKDKKIYELTEKLKEDNLHSENQILKFELENQKDKTKHYYELGNELKKENESYKEKLSKLDKITEFENTIEQLNEKLLEANHENITSSTENTKLKYELGEKNNKLNLYENKIKSYENELEKLKEDNSELKKIKEEYEEENQKLNLFIEQVNEQIKKIPEGMDLNELTQEYEGLKEQNNNLTTENIELKSNLDNSQLINTQLNEQIKNLKNQLNNITLKGDAGIRINDLENQLKKKDEEILNLKKENMNATSSNILSNEQYKGQISNLIEKIKNLEEELNNAKEENNKIESLEIQLKQAEEDNEILHSKVNDYENIINNTNNLDSQQLNSQNAILKNKNIQLQNQNIYLQNQIEEIKEELSKKNKEKEILDERMKKIVNSGFDDNDTEEQLRQKIIMLRMKIKDNEDSISRANAAIKKAEFYDNCVNYTNIILKNYKPTNENEINALNKLKHMFDETKDIPKYYKNLDNGDIDLFTSNDLSISGESQKIGNNLEDLLNS